MNLDDLLDRTWTTGYTCNEFVCEAWQKITGENLKDRLEAFLNEKGDFKQLDVPDPPCLVLLSNNSRSSTHVGLFYCNKVLHLSMRGVQFVPLEYLKMHFRDVRFYQ